MKEGKEFRHPSYGMIAISRYTTPSERLFGSAIKTDSGIMLSIHRGYRMHDLHQDRYHADTEPLISVNMTEAQFANMITSLNIGGGLPCTIEYFNGERIEPSKENRSEAEMVHDDIKSHVEGFKDKLKKSTEKLKKMLGGIRMTQQDRKAVLFAFDVLLAEVATNLPFLMEQFRESVDRGIAQAKAEIVSFADRTLKQKGLEALQGGVPQIGLDEK